MTPGTSRTLDFDDAVAATDGALSRKRTAPDGEGALVLGDARQRRDGSAPLAFAELRPAGEEGAETAAVIAALERAMAGAGRL
eukprot:4504515-Pleurochrysis_carterae.AAC.1